MKRKLTILLILLVAVLHFGAMLAVGALAFASQGDLDNPGPPSRVHRVFRAGAAVLEFPLVTAVRKLSPERLRGFLPAAVGNSLLWGCALGIAASAICRRSNVEKEHGQQGVGG